jgi:hypothetical protein
VNLYYDPRDFGLEVIGEIDWSDGCYQFDLTAVWRRANDGRFVYAEDAGCSCPSPFENTGVDELTVLRQRGGLADFKAHLEERQAEPYREDRAQAVADLLERMHAAGAR